MFGVILLMFCGIGIGYLFKKVAVLQKVNVSIAYTIYVLLFLLGVSVGSNKTILENLDTLGLEAVLIAVSTTMGSVVAAWIVYKFFFKKREVGK